MGPAAREPCSVQPLGAGGGDGAPLPAAFLAAEEGRLKHDVVALLVILTEWYEHVGAFVKASTVRGKVLQLRRLNPREVL